jgi:hypothetical protein
MDGTAIVAAGSAVSAAVELLKRANVVPTKYAIAVVIGISLVVVALWAWTAGDFSQATAFGYLTGWLSVSGTAVGAYEGVSRANAALSKQ